LHKLNRFNWVKRKDEILEKPSPMAEELKPLRDYVVPSVEASPLSIFVNFVHDIIIAIVGTHISPTDRWATRRKGIFLSCQEMKIKLQKTKKKKKKNHKEAACSVTSADHQVITCSMAYPTLTRGLQPPNPKLVVPSHDSNGVQAGKALCLSIM
ncbi:unnamed protein product, partial [Prunus brigantina]